MSRLISFPQAFALNKGANYPINANFTGLPIATLRAAGGFKFNQPAFQTPAANLYNSATTTYAFATTSTSGSAGLVYKFGGNLVDTAIRWTNGKSKGNWIEIQRHGAVDTRGTVQIVNNEVRITSGLNSDLTVASRSVLHDTKFQRNGTEQLPTNNSVVGWLMERDKVNTTLYFKGYVDVNSLMSNGLLDEDLMKQKTVRVGYWYAHSVDTFIPSINSCIGSSHGFGFIPGFTSGAYTWKGVYITTRASTNNMDVIVLVETNLSAFIPQQLKVNFNNGVVSWFAGNMVTPIQTADILDTVAVPDQVIFSGSNALYAGLMSIALQDSLASGLTLIPGAATLCVQEAATWREYPGDGLLNVSATLATGTNNVTVGNTTGIVPGMRVTKVSGTGAFNSTATSGNGTFVGVVSSGTSFTIVDHLQNAANHATAGAIVFDVGKGLFAFNNFEDTNTEVTATDIAYQTTGLQLLKKLK